MNKCDHCKKEVLEGHNYCDFKCHIAAAQAAGCTEHLPNGLPIKCITATGKLLEHEHGDHPNYLRPVKVLLHGCRFNIKTGDYLVGPEYSDSQIHALIFYDGTASVTLYEAVYYFWVGGKIRYTKYDEDFYSKHNAELVFE